ncbi:MAG: reverse transcriptase-like protein [Alphaproteobacteria bacterium]|nr:reverse transcriptase-like protein [Alphaproteobacteria bacterium]
MRYSDAPGAKVYNGGAERLSDVRGEVVELADAAPAGAKGKAFAASGFGSAGSRSKAQAAAAAEAASSLVASLPAGTAIAFTDGGCKGNPGPAGSGVRLELPDGRVAEASRALGVATNNVAELTAVGIALELLAEAGLPPDAPVALLSDSQYAHGVLQKGWKAKANAELIADLRTRLKARPGVVFHWVAGHAGVAGNERADALATDGVSGRTAVRWTPAPG